MYGIRVTTSDGANSVLGVRVFREVAYQELIFTGGQNWYRQDLLMTPRISGGLEGGSYVFFATASALTSNIDTSRAAVMVDGSVPTTLVKYVTPLPSSISVTSVSFKTNSAEGRLGVSLFLVEV